MTIAFWACLRCHRTEGRKADSRLCRSCLDQLARTGQAWCSGCHQAVSGLSRLKVCKACTSRYWRTANAKRRIRPPEGWITIPTLARRLHYTPAALRRWLRLGWMRDQRWQACPRSPSYVPDLATYPPPPSTRKRAPV